MVTIRPLYDFYTVTIYIFQHTTAINEARHKITICSPYGYYFKFKHGALDYYMTTMWLPFNILQNCQRIPSDAFWLPIDSYLIT